MCNSPASGEWTALPDLTPEDIRAARNTKASFTGDLERKIITNPFFFKQEKHYLRAQIARISHSTRLAPGKRFRFQEESTEDIEENTPEEGDIVPQTTQEMSNKASWVHYARSILNNCRVTHLEPEQEDGDEEDPEALLKKIKAADPSEPRLKPITGDAAVQGGFPAWTLRTFGDKTNYKSANPAFADQNNSVVVVRSLTWTGAYNFYTNQQYLSVYVGDGHKYEAATYFPIQPPCILSDPEERLVFNEPNPSEAETGDSEIDLVIKKCVNDIWNDYDKDNSGVLEKDEAKKFVQASLLEISDNGEFDDAAFEECFNEFD